MKERKAFLEALLVTDMIRVQIPMLAPLDPHTQYRTVQSATGKVLFARLDQSGEGLIWPDMNGKGNGGEW